MFVVKHCDQINTSPFSSRSNSHPPSISRGHCPYNSTKRKMPLILITKSQVMLAVLIQFAYHLNGISGLDLDPDPSQEVTDPNNIHIFRYCWRINPAARICNSSHRKSGAPWAAKRTPTENQILCQRLLIIAPLQLFLLACIYLCRSKIMFSLNFPTEGLACEAAGSLGKSVSACSGPPSTDQRSCNPRIPPPGINLKSTWFEIWLGW